MKKSEVSVAKSKKSVKKAKPAKKAAAKSKPVKKAVRAKTTMKAKSKPKATAKTIVKTTAILKKSKPAVGKKAKASSVKPKASAKGTAAVKSSVQAKPVVKKTVKLDLSEMFTPLDDRLIVQLAEAERKTAGGLYIPDTVSDVSGNLRGFVVSVGRGKKDKKGRVHPLDVAQGDQVIFPEYAGSKIQLMGHELVILKESEVMGIVS